MATAQPVTHADKIHWLTDEPVWVEQWPLTQGKIVAAQALVEEQLWAGYIILSTSPWNSPIFLIRKKSGRWRLLQHLWKVNATMQLMGSLQPGLPNPSAIPKNSYIAVIDLKDCFYTIPLHPANCCRFAFSVPSVNFKEPMRRYHWQVLPQGMANSPTLCQQFVASVISSVRTQFPSLYIIHYMDDILLAGLKESEVHLCLSIMKEQLCRYGLQVAPEKCNCIIHITILVFNFILEKLSHKRWLYD